VRERRREGGREGGREGEEEKEGEKEGKKEGEKEGEKTRAHSTQKQQQLTTPSADAHPTCCPRCRQRQCTHRRAYSHVHAADMTQRAQVGAILEMLLVSWFKPGCWCEE
jgi:hypothetical protein